MSSDSFAKKLELATRCLSDAEALWIGAGAGLTAAAGFDFTDKAAFARDYAGMLQYGFTSKLDMMANFSVSRELLWGYYLQHVKEIRFAPGTNMTYQHLLAIARRLGNYFVITTNADGLFERNNFAPERLFTPQGDYKLAQCLTPCTQHTWSVETLIEQYLPLVDKATQKLPPGGDPKCPYCGGPTFLNVRGGSWFVEKPWMEGARRYEKWLAVNKTKRIVLLDIGSGFNTPVWIRWPAERITRTNPAARLLRLNLHHAEVPHDIAGRSLSFAEPAHKVLEELANVLDTG